MKHLYLIYLFVYTHTHNSEFINIEDHNLQHALCFLTLSHEPSFAGKNSKPPTKQIKTE